VWEWFGYPGLKLRTDKLIDVLDRLFQHGDLVGFANDPNSPDELIQFVPTRNCIGDGVSRNKPFGYGRTLQGGKRWETAARADWARFYQVGMDEKTISITGADRNFIERSLTTCQKAQQFRIVRQVWKVLEPYHVTYWKLLDIGYEVTYEYSYSKSKTDLFDQQPYPDPPEWYVEP
jgi:hypothetical protein